MIYILFICDLYTSVGFNLNVISQIETLLITKMSEKKYISIVSCYNYCPDTVNIKLIMNLVTSRAKCVSLAIKHYGGNKELWDTGTVSGAI